jgi:hypothetical protein
MQNYLLETYWRRCKEIVAGVLSYGSRGERKPFRQMERTVIYINTLDNERIMFRNGEYLNLRNNTNKFTTWLHLLILLHNFEQYFL